MRELDEKMPWERRWKKACPSRGSGGGNDKLAKANGLRV